MGKPGVSTKVQEKNLIVNHSKTEIRDRNHKRSKHHSSMNNLNRISFSNPVSLKPLSATAAPGPVVPKASMKPSRDRAAPGPVVTEALVGGKLLGKRKKDLKHVDSIRKHGKVGHIETNKNQIGNKGQFPKTLNFRLSGHLSKNIAMQAQTERHKVLPKIQKTTIEDSFMQKKKKTYNKVLTGKHVKNNSTVTEPGKVQKVTHNNKRRRLLKNRIKEKKKLEKKKRLEERKVAIMQAADKMNMNAVDDSLTRTTPKSVHVVETQKAESHEAAESLLSKGADHFSANWKSLIASKQILPIQKKIRDKSSHEKRFNKIRQSKRQQETAQRSDDIWFDDVDKELLDLPVKPAMTVPRLTDEKHGQAENTGLTKCLAMDCEMVGVGHGGTESVLARVSLVNMYGHCVYDKFVKSRESVTDYRTFVSGIRPENLKAGAETFETVQKEVSDLIQGHILVGHALHNDFQVLFISHPHKSTRDTARYKPFKKLLGARPSLKKLAEKVLGVTIQTGEHNSVEDAQTAMRLYTLHRKAWERLYVRKPKR